MAFGYCFVFRYLEVGFIDLLFWFEYFGELVFGNLARIGGYFA